jgi:hypothetical protein
MMLAFCFMAGRVCMQNVSIAFWERDMCSAGFVLLLAMLECLLCTCACSLKRELAVPQLHVLSYIASSTVMQKWIQVCCARLHVLEEGGEERPVLLLREGQVAVGGGRVEPGMPSHLQCVQTALQHLIRILVLPSCPEITTELGDLITRLLLCNCQAGRMLTQISN